MSRFGRRESKEIQGKGGLIPRARYKFEGKIAAKHRACKGETPAGSFAYQAACTPSRTCALPTSTTATDSNPKVTSKTNRSGIPSALQHASIGALPHPGQLPPRYRPAFPGASSCRWRSAWRCSSSAAGGAAGRAAPASGGSSGRSEPSKGLEPFRRPLAGLGERSKAVSEALRTVARAWASDKAELEDDRGRAGSAPPGGWAARAGRARRRGLMEAAGLGLAGLGYRESLEQAKASRLKGFWRRAWARGRRNERP